MLPVRCYTCGKVLAQLQKQWEQHKSEDWSGFFEEFDIKRYCCKRVLMAHVPDKNQLVQYALPPSVQLSEEKDDIVRFYLAR